MLGYPPALGGHQPFLHRPRADLTGPLPVGLSAPRGPLANGCFRPPRRGNVAAGHLAQLTGVSPAQIYLILPAVQAEADRFVGGLGVVEVIDQGHGNASHHVIPLLSAGRVANQPRVCCVSDHEPVAVTLFGSRRLMLFIPPAEQPSDLTACHLDLPRLAAVATLNPRSGL
jgi:hypothetical protein